MLAQPTPDKENPSLRMPTALGRFLLRALLALSLLYYVAMVLDLVLHPLALGVGYDAFFVERLLSVLSGTGVIVIGLFITRRVPGNRAGALLIIYGVGGVSWETRADWGSPLLTSLTHLFLNFYTNGIANAALFILLLSFPSGQFYPRRIGRYVALYIVLLLIGITLVVMAQRPGGATFFEGDLPGNPLFVPALAPYYDVIAYATLLLFILGIGAAVASLILRYRAAPFRERQQIKWFVWVTAVVLAFTIIIAAILIFDPNNVALGTPLGIALVILFTEVLQSYPAIGIGIAILRHRLWDIDIIINRTLVYGALTGILALVYTGSILLLQYLLQGIIHQGNDVAIVISTLLIAALFGPLRRRIQSAIDRRFYRRKYDAARTLAEFNAVLRNEVELSDLCDQLLTVIQETMQPAHVSLWLRQPEREFSYGRSNDAWQNDQV